jgi:hypothetical protein
MQGVQIPPRKGQDPMQITLALMKGMDDVMRRIRATSGMPTPPELAGLINVAITASSYLQMAAQDPANQEMAGAIQKRLAEIMKVLQQFNEQIQQQRQQNGQGIDPKIQKELALTQAKVEGMQIQAQTKAQIEAQKNAQRLSQSEQRFIQGQRQKEEEHLAKLRGELSQGQVDTTIKDAKAASDIQNERIRTMLEAAPEEEPPNA